MTTKTKRTWRFVDENAVDLLATEIQTIEEAEPGFTWNPDLSLYEIADAEAHGFTVDLVTGETFLADDGDTSPDLYIGSLKARGLRLQATEHAGTEYTPWYIVVPAEATDAQSPA